MQDINSQLENLQKFTKPQLAALKKLEIISVRDLLLYFPYRYLDFTKTINVKDLKPEENISLRVKIKSISSRFSFRGRMSLAEALVSDDTGSLKVTWFNQAYLAKTLKAGDEIFLAGAAEYYKNSLQLTNPIYEKVSDFPVHTSRLVPVYHLKSGLYPKTLRNLIKTYLPLANKITDILPPQIIKNQGLLTLPETIYQSHFPESAEQLEAAKKRLAFEEIFFSQLAAQKTKMEMAKKQSYASKFDQALTKTFLAGLPFELTLEQKKSAWEIMQDLEKTEPMNRLLEGDVGSGKTLVAFMAALQTISKGYQAVFLAPTEILAKQHFDTALKYFKIKNLKFKICLLTNTYSIIDSKTVPKEKFYKLISDGMPGIYFGTHALLQKNVTFKKLALVIIDEQHRWGVEQRSALIQQGTKIPHLLSLSATPIPRTLKLAFFGELDISQIKTKPKDRKPILTKAVLPENRAQAYKFIDKQIALGRQAFVITPLVEESDKLGVKSATGELELLKKIFPKLKIGLLHGRLKSAEKEAVMSDFLANKIQILVATSVVEVGVDVPNASVMIIEAAERFGLSQLHQFRGRVGRAEHQSYCFLFSGKETPENLARLEEFSKTQDGFALAELDLKQRGFGQLYGTEQAGWDFKHFNLSYTSLIEPARQEAHKILNTDITLAKYPLLQDKIKNRIIHFE
jgi:ATP-dependent DNA helicase RecG